MYRKPLLALSLCAALLCCAAAAPALALSCAPPPIVANAKSNNMFTPEQEMVFGELWVQNMAGEIRFVRDERLTAYVNRIGERIIKHLPQTGLKFRFYLVDIPEANAFNLPGGHVAISRKLVAFVNSEDELAGVIGHELGHDLKRGAIVGGLDKDDAAFHGTLIAYESVDGNILLRESSYDEQGRKLELKDVGTFEIPVSPVRGLAASDVSDDFGWLLLSSKTRGGLWSLKKGERKAYLRGFKGAVAANDGGAVGEVRRARSRSPVGA